LIICNSQATDNEPLSIELCTLVTELGYLVIQARVLTDMGAIMCGTPRTFQ